jgi:sporulation protein YlmC with PRC-barrel domain
MRRCQHATDSYSDRSGSAAWDHRSCSKSATNVSNAATLTTIPGNSSTVANYYKQNVYDMGDNKVGQIKDVLVDSEGKVTALIIAAGGFLGMGEHDVAVPFKEVKGTQKDGKWYLTMSASKDALKAAPGFTYDSAKTSWVPEGANTTGSGRK